MDERQARELGADGLLAPPIELVDLVPYLFGVVDAWREAHPGRPYADQANRMGAGPDSEPPAT